MAAKGLGFTGTVVAGIVTTAFIAIWSYFVPSTDAAWLRVMALWGWLTSAVSWVWSIVTYPIPVPVWLPAMLTAFGATLWNRRQRPPVPAKPVELSDQQKQMLAVLVMVDGQALTIDVLSRTVGLRILEGERISEKLIEVGLIEVVNGRSALLTTAGRDYALDQGLVGNRELQEQLRHARWDSRGL